MAATFCYKDAQMKKTLVHVSGSIALAALNEKFSSAAAYKIADIDSVADLVLEANAPEIATKSLSGKVARVHWVDPIV